MKQDTLKLDKSKPGPVECLGQTFPSDEARREHYLKLLAEKLKDPEFRKIEGFPVGEDKDILALSDPPYYTACPNPWIPDFIKCNGSPYNPKDKYHREPFAVDVSEGKKHPLYLAHSYHTKVPHRAIMRYILHFTNPGDIVFDGFCGTGMTGVAAQLCGNESEIQELGYRVLENGDIVDQAGKIISRIGKRYTIQNDLSPVATFISRNYNAGMTYEKFFAAANKLLEQTKAECQWMYTTTINGRKENVDYFVWSEVFSCSDCGAPIIFSDVALDEDSGKISTVLDCPSCGSTQKKEKLVLQTETYFDPLLKKTAQRPKRQLHLIVSKSGKKSIAKGPSEADKSILKRIDETPIPHWVPTNAIPDMQMMRVGRMKSSGIEFAHQFFLKRQLITLSTMWHLAGLERNPDMRAALLFFVEQAIWGMSILARYTPTHFSQVNQYLSGVFYMASHIVDVSPDYILKGKLKRLKSALMLTSAFRGGSAISTQDTSTIEFPENCIDYAFVDPPFGENIYYSDLNLLIESFHRVLTNSSPEAIVDRVKGKCLGSYSTLMSRCFASAYKCLKPGRWMTVEFSNSSAAVWNAIQTGLSEAGFVVANVSALDKQHRSFQSIVSPTAVKQDLVISAYKPNGGLEHRFQKSGHTVEGVWDFVRTHLRNLPVIKARGGELEFITERDPRILYDRMVAFYVGHGVPVPLSSAEFQAALADKFPEREGMFFLPEQVGEWDKKRSKMQGVGQMSIFVEDEKSAIDWLRTFLKTRPSTYQDTQPEFMQQLGASWKKFESRPELNLLLEQNFLRYDGKGDVPSQIHGYLSTQFKELRNLAKDDAQLKARAKDRWFVPDPAKAVDVESVRNKRLSQEFWELCAEAGITRLSGSSSQQALPLAPQSALKKSSRKKLKEVRTEAVRFGFKECFAAKDYATILAIATHLPENVIEEDEQLQMMHDMAEMRVRG